MQSDIVSQIFDALQRRGVLNCPDAGIAAVGGAFLAAMKNSLRHLGNAIAAACATEDQLREWT